MVDGAKKYWSFTQIFFRHKTNLNSQDNKQITSINHYLTKQLYETSKKIQSLSQKTILLKNIFRTKIAKQKEKNQISQQYSIIT